MTKARNRRTPHMVAVVMALTLLASTVTLGSAGAASRSSHHRHAGSSARPHSAARCRKAAARGTSKAGTQRCTPLASPPLGGLRSHRIGDIFGVGSYVTQRSSDVAGPTISRAVDLDAGWVREELTATRLHSSTRGRYRWRSFDRVVDAERRSGLHVFGLLDYSNTWGYPNHGYMPHAAIRRLAANFATYAYAVARHFRGRIRYWQIWNEPDRTVFWKPAANAADYARLLDAAYRAVKRADPRDVVVLAGTTDVDMPFIHAVLRAGGRFDVVAVHPYRNLPETALLATVRALRALHKPIWFSEIGWAAGAGCWECTDESDQAAYLVRFYALAAATGVRRVFWYDLRDDPNSITSPEAHFGLVRRDLSAKPAYVAYAALARVLRGARFVRADALGVHGLYALRFATAHGAAEVTWNAGAASVGVAITWHGRAFDVDELGAVTATRTASGRMVVFPPVGGVPLLITARRPRIRLPRLGPLLHLTAVPTPTARVTVTATPRPRPTPTPGGAWVARPSPTPRAMPSPTSREVTVTYPGRSTPTPSRLPTRIPTQTPTPTATSVRQ
jgi:hypothetical protein